MSPATHPPTLREGVRLLLVDEAEGSVRDAGFAELASELEPGDLLVVNDAATLPASISGRVVGEQGEEAVELRLLGPLAGRPSDDEANSEASPERGPERSDDRDWRAVLFGAGDWRDDTDDRPAPPILAPGATLELRGGLRATILGHHEASARLVELRFDRGGARLYAALYAAGRPIQYSHLDAPLELWSVQTMFAGRPWAAEMPSAGRPLTAGSIAALRRRGIEIARLTHAAGISATGDAGLDALLPLPERYEIPAQTIAAIERTRARGGRVIAVGTTVVRALESAAELDGVPRAGPGVTDRIITADTTLRVVDGLLTGMHAAHESHYRLLRAFAPQALLERAWAAALDAGYRSHEFGDLALITRRERVELDARGETPALIRHALVPGPAGSSVLETQRACSTQRAGVAG